MYECKYVCIQMSASVSVIVTATAYVYSMCVWLCLCLRMFYAHIETNRAVRNRLSGTYFSSLEARYFIGHSVLCSSVQQYSAALSKSNLIRFGLETPQLHRADGDAVLMVFSIIARV